MNDFMLVSAKTKHLYSYKDSAEKLLLNEGSNLDAISLCFCYLPNQFDDALLDEKWINVLLKLDDSKQYKINCNETVICLKQRIEKDFSVSYKQQLLKLNGNILLNDPFAL